MKCFIAFLCWILVVQTFATEDLCLGSCVKLGWNKKICTFKFKVDLHASEFGYYTVDGCDGTMPTLGIRKYVTNIFIQEHQSNYNHPLGFAYYPDGAHDDKDELEPGVCPPGAENCNCAHYLSCPAPMYMKAGQCLGEYNNNPFLKPRTQSTNFGLDIYEPDFTLPSAVWNAGGPYQVALYFDDRDFTQDMFYFCHKHQFMAGRIKFVDGYGQVLQQNDFPSIPYTYEMPSQYDQKCGTSGLEDFQLPHPECPSRFVCDKPDGGSVEEFSGCLESMNCAMFSGMTTNIHMGDAIALFNHQMIPHHQNAVNMCKAFFQFNSVRCDDMTDMELAENDPDCTMTHLCYEIINGQNTQIQTMRRVNDVLGFDYQDDCEVLIP